MELLERRMTERVEEAVRKKLLKRYSLISGGVLSVLAVFGYEKITDYEAQLNEYAQLEATKAAEAAVKPAIQNATDAASEAKAVAKEAQNKALRAGVQLEEMDRWRLQGQVKLSKALDKIAESDAKIDQSLISIDMALAGI